ncbi:MAG: DNA-3-methyladenine glycosylase I [Candidatus Kariarchaeaceae archaeon]|jgi:DNA-3-methyladenine glycosylase I
MSFGVREIEVGFLIDDLSMVLMTLTDSEYFAHLTRAIFNTGFSREVISAKWDGFTDAFSNFDISKVAKYNTGDIMGLLERDDIVRNTKKIEATVFNAGVLQDIIKEYGSIHDYIRSFDDMDFDTRVKNLKKPFKFVGPMTAKIFLWLSGEKVPEHH